MKKYAVGLVALLVFALPARAQTVDTNDALIQALQQLISLLTQQIQLLQTQLEQVKIQDSIIQDQQNTLNQQSAQIQNQQTALQTQQTVLQTQQNQINPPAGTAPDVTQTPPPPKETVLRATLTGGVIAVDLKTELTLTSTYPVTGVEIIRTDTGASLPLTKIREATIDKTGYGNLTFTNVYSDAFEAPPMGSLMASSADMYPFRVVVYSTVGSREYTNLPQTGTNATVYTEPIYNPSDYATTGSSFPYAVRRWDFGDVHQDANLNWVVNN